MHGIGQVEAVWALPLSPTLPASCAQSEIIPKHSGGSAHG